MSVEIVSVVMRLDDKLAALDNHAARRMHVSEWQHLRALAAAEGDSVIVAECDYRIAKLTTNREDAQEQAARAIHRDIRTYGWAYNAGVSW